MPSLVVMCSFMLMCEVVACVCDMGAKMPIMPHLEWKRVFWPHSLIRDCCCACAASVYLIWSSYCYCSLGYSAPSVVDHLMPTGGVIRSSIAMTPIGASNIA